MTGKRALALVVAACVVAAGCTAVDATFMCHENEQCSAAGVIGGRCEADHYCSVTDTSCPSGRRYKGAPGDLCVGATDGGMTDQSIDAANPDLADLAVGDLAGCSSMHLNALHPDVAAPGDTVWVEGTFAAGAKVIFPTTSGSQSVIAAPTQAASRLSVVVPANATRGMVTVQVAACVTDALPIEIVGASLDLLPSPMASTVETLGSDAQEMVYTGDRMIVLGGADDGANPRDIDVAMVMPAPTPAPQFTSAGTLNSGRIQPCVVFVGDRIHVIGGTPDGNNVLATREEIALADFPGGFTQLSTGLSTARAGHSCVAIGAWLYAIGGDTNGTGNTTVATIERAPILPPNGELGTFTDTGLTLNTARESFGTVVVGSWLYVFGGINDANNNVDQIERAAIDADGNLGTFANWGAFLDAASSDAYSLNGVLSEFTSLRVGSREYIFGGFSSGGVRSLVLSTAIGASDDLGMFVVQATQLSVARSRASTAVVNGRLYVVGGQSQSGDPVDSLDQSFFE